MQGHDVAALLAALALASVHLLSSRLRFLEGIPRSRWLSAAGGISVAYVFVHLMPELAEGQKAVEGEGGEARATDGLLPFLEHHVYLLALVGLAVFYGVEKHSLSARRHRQATTGEDQTTGAAFWLSVASFTAYNAMIGYLLLRRELEPLGALALYTVALGVHFVINDFTLRGHHKDAYDRVGRWLISAGVLVGWALGVAAEISERALALVLAFIAGGVVLNVLKEELPGERQAWFWPFFLAAALYAALLQAL